MARTWLQLRWSGRELRRRRIQVAVIALIIAVGTGVYSGLGSTRTWRLESNDASYALLHMYDLRVSLSEGSYVPTGGLLGVLAHVEHPSWVRAAEERLIAPTQVDASTSGETILVPGRLVGVEVSDGGPHVNGIYVTRGWALTPADAASAVAILEAHFADHYDLPSQGQVRLPGGASIRYVGAGLSPEYFMVTTETGAFLAEANFAVLFAPLATVQALTGHPNQVNDLVLTLAPGVNVQAAREEVTSALAADLPNVGVTVADAQEDVVHRVLYQDVDQDQRFWNVFAFLVFAGAVFAAFNLTSRIVESQRREIGTAMALGVPRWRIALRPLLVGAEIAFLGVVFGIGVGLAVAAEMKVLFEQIIPLPVWKTPFQSRVFVEAATLGFVLPFAGVAWPVWRAVRVNPVDAIKTGHLAAKGGGLAPLLRRVAIPGDSLAQMPFRNVLRAPRRTLLTALGIGAAITAMIGTIGMLDSFSKTIDRGASEVLSGAPDRVTVDLAGFYPTTADVLRAIEGSPAVGRAEPSLRVSSVLSKGEAKVDAFIDLVDLASGLWRPTIIDRVAPSGPPGIYLAEKAASDLGVRPGDTITVEHPVRQGLYAFRTVRTRMEVLGLHPNPLRFVAYMDMADAGLMGLSGTANVVEVTPAAGSSRDDVKRALFAIPGVASVQPVGATVDLFRDLVKQFVRILRLVEVFVLALALLIAFNAASINVDERAREHATMFAFGMRLRTLLRMATTEGIVVGFVGTLIGLALGLAVLGWIVAGMVAETVPEIGVVTFLSPWTVLAAFVLGVLAVALAPLLTVRKMRRADLPSALRVME